MAVQPAQLEQPRYLAPVEVLERPHPGRITIGPWPERAYDGPTPVLQPARPVQIWQALAHVLAAWAYPAAASRRDLRVDLLRGLCVFAMLADHLGGESWLYVFTGGNRGYVSAAEGFIFISGLVVGQVYGSKLGRLGLGQTIAQALRRARTLYLATVAMTLIFTGLRLFTDLALWVPRSVSPSDQSLIDVLVGAITLHWTYHGTDILAMYVFCLVAAGAGLVLLAHGHWRLLLAGSWLVWLGFQVRPDQVVVPWYIRNSENFPLGAWQVLFVTGLVLGFHRQRLERWLQARPRARFALLGLAVGVSLVVTLYYNASGDAAFEVFAKVPLRPARLVGFAAAAILAYTLMTHAWQPLRRAMGWLLLPLGQHALYCYIVHFFLIVLIVNVLPADIAWQVSWLSPTLIGTLLQLGLIGAVWVLVRRRILFGVVPT